MSIPSCAPELGLAREILATGGRVRLRAFGSSMLPSLWPGDVLTIEGVSCHAPVPGDIVLVLHHERPFIHRVKQRQERDGRPRWITRGDAVPQSDPPVTEGELLGKVLFIERNRRIIVPRGRLSVSDRALAWMLCHWDRLRSVCLRMHSFRNKSALPGTAANLVMAERRPEVS